MLAVPRGECLDAQDETGCLALGLAAQQGDADMVRHLLVRGANVNMPDFYGQTALHFAAEYGHTEVADVLIMAGMHANSGITLL